MARLHSFTATAPTTGVHHCCCTSSDGCADVQQRPALHGDQLGRTKRRRWTFFMLDPRTNVVGCGGFGREWVKLESFCLLSLVGYSVACLLLRTPSGELSPTAGSRLTTATISAKNLNYLTSCQAIWQVLVIFGPKTASGGGAPTIAVTGWHY